MIGVKLQANTEPYPGEDVRFYEVGRELVFVEYDPDEQIHGKFRPFDRVVVVADRNACGMGLDVIRKSDGLCDMVWVNEVALAEVGR